MCGLLRCRHRGELGSDSSARAEAMHSCCHLILLEGFPPSASPIHLSCPWRDAPLGRLQLGEEGAQVVRRAGERLLELSAVTLGTRGGGGGGVGREGEEGKGERQR